MKGNLEESITLFFKFITEFFKLLNQEVEMDGRMNLSIFISC